MAIITIDIIAIVTITLASADCGGVGRASPSAREEVKRAAL